VTQAITVNGRKIPAGITRYETQVHGQPVYGGANDPRLGNIHDKSDPGYFGHLELAKPVYHPGMVDVTLKTLRCICIHCSKLRMSDEEFKFQKVKRIPSRKRRLAAFHDLLRNKKQCDHCQGLQPKLTKVGLHIEADYPEDANVGGGDTKQFLSGQTAVQVLRRMREEDMKSLGLDVTHARPEWCLVQVLPVPPLHVRPSVHAGGATSEDDLTHQLVNVIKSNLALKQAIHNGEPNIIVEQFEHSLQHNVAAFMNNELRGMPQVTQRSGRPLKTIYQRLKGKEGRIRGNLMGKRVDFSARTVITADPNLGIHQVGVPRSVAMNLTVPDRVTAYNVAELSALVANGPTVHPGAKHIIRSDGTRVDLRFVKNKSELLLAHGWIVERHLRDGDVVLFNRQPSLHKMSIMGHRAKVLDWSTFRLNLSCTSPYNADFDGDEMNLHVPQSLPARAEAELMMLSPRVIVSGQSNRPVMGIIQDTLLAVQKMTKRDVFLEKDLVFNMLMWIPQWDGNVPIPAILKPKELWTGKQMLSMILPKINLKSKANNGPGKDASGKTMPNTFNGYDHLVTIQEGELLEGTIDKKTIGSSMGGLIHTAWLDAGYDDTARFMNQVQQVVNYWVLQSSFSIGVTDAVADVETMRQIESTINKAKLQVLDLVRQGQRGELETQPGRTMIESFEQYVNKVLNTARDHAGKSAQGSLDETNSVKAMVTAGSKGSFINISQIIACVGQQNVEGKRIPYGFKRRTLPHFSKDDLGPESRGFVENSYLRGLSPQEFFFHAMGGREGLIDTACKTAETGYIQRRLVKAMETVMARYDGTLRTSGGQIVQFLYGEDGMDAVWIEKQQFDSLTLAKEEFEKRYVIHTSDADFGYDDQNLPYLGPEVMDDCRNEPEVQLILDREVEVLREDQRTLRVVMANREAGRESDDSSYAPGNIRRVIHNAIRQFRIDRTQPSDLHPRDVIKKVTALVDRLVVVVGDDPLSVEAQTNATTLYRILVRSLLSTKRVLKDFRLSEAALNWVIGEVETRFNQAMVNPGEMAGVLAAQSIGEPATQMTLNVSVTVHLIPWLYLLAIFHSYRFPLAVLFPFVDFPLRWCVSQECDPWSSATEGNHQRCQDS
jgi:DNA-directed RNA polymerase II subunit RPB1